MNLIRKPLIPGVLVLFFALGVSLPACSAQGNAKDSDAKASGSSAVLAVVDGKPITEAEVRESLDSQAKQQLQEILENGMQPATGRSVCSRPRPQPGEPPRKRSWPSSSRRR